MMPEINVHDNTTKKLPYFVIFFIGLISVLILGICGYIFFQKNSKPFGAPFSPSLSHQTVTPTSLPLEITATSIRNKDGITLSQGEMLGQRPVITGGMGWGIKGINGREIFFKKAKDLGITYIRFMRVLTASNDWSKMDYAINTVSKNGQQIMLCIGDLASPPITKREINQNSILIKQMLEHLISIYGIEKVNNLPVELSNEYGADNLPYLLTTYYDAIKQVEAAHSGLSIRIVASAPQRGDYDNFEKALKYMREKNMSLYAISAHYYLRGARKNVPHELPFADWIGHIRSTMKQYAFDSLPLYIDEYGLSGIHSDKQLKESYNAAWTASRLGDATYYNQKNVVYFISAVYGQPFNSKVGGWLGLFDGYGGSAAPYPLEREFELEQRLSGALFLAKGIPSDLKAKGVGGVSDEKGQWLLWNMADTPVTFNIPANGNRIIGLIDRKNGNSNTLMQEKGNTLNQSSLYTLSDPFNDPQNGKVRLPIQPVGTDIQIIIKEQGVAFIGIP